MQTKQALVIVVGMALLVLLTLSPKAVDMSNPPRIDNHTPANTNCYTASLSTNCTEGSVVLTNASVTPTSGCVLSAFSASAFQIIVSGTNVIRTACTNSSGGACTNGC